MKIRTILFIVLALIVGGLIIYTYFPDIVKPSNKEILIQAEKDSVTVEPVEKLFGIPVDSFDIDTGKIARRQNLSGLLQKFNLPDGTYQQAIVSLNTNKIFNSRKVKAGNEYVVFFTKDTLHLLQYLVYEDTPVNYYILDFTDSVRISAGVKKVHLVEKKFAGKIKTSLWDAITSKNADPMLAIDLSEIYAWTIDFFDLQPGDSFSVIYNVNYIDTNSIGISNITTAFFRHSGQDIYAIPFIQDSTKSYFDSVGNSLRKAFLKAPLRFSRISSRFSYSRFHPILKIRRPHLGVDYAAPIGTPVHAIGDGKIIRVSHTRGAGNMVKIRHNSIYTTSYMHLSHFGKGIRTGAYVKQGDIIGYVGSTGLSTGPHLDFRFYKNGKPIDPLKVKAPPVEPVHEANRVAFDSVRTLMISRLDSLKYQ
jgi:murein DD-endopeptidase MepM/ murein hydrolase activator NlpD